MNKLYKEFYKERLFTLAQAKKVIKDHQQCKNTLQRLIKQGYIVRAHAGIYYIIPIDNKQFVPDPIHIASKLKQYICNQTALHILTKQSITMPITLGSSYTRKIRMKQYTYQLIKHHAIPSTINYQTPYSEIKIQLTDLEQTIIDCIKYRSLKIEELITLLTNASPEININKIQQYLEQYKQPILFHKTGLILEIYALKTGKIRIEDLERLKHKSKKIYYFKERGFRLIKPKYKYQKGWHLMIPEQIQKLLVKQ